eukprot:Gb_28563 [translate_table: standard]
MPSHWELTGYDRVMVYKFHEDKHGEVVAEIRRLDLEPYLGLHYLATDEEWRQSLCSVGSTLRSPHGCHAKYMVNMDLIASLVMAMIINGIDEGIWIKSGMALVPIASHALENDVIHHGSLEPSCIRHSKLPQWENNCSGTNLWQPIIKLSINFSSNLQAYALKGKVVNILQHVKEGKDFMAFEGPLCKAMEVCKGIETHVSMDREKRGMGAPQELCQSHLMTGNCFVSSKEEIGSPKWLQTVFSKLLHEIDSCLKALEDVLDAPTTLATEDHSFSWAPFLVVLKCLHAIAKLYEGGISMEFITEEATSPSALREWFTLDMDAEFMSSDALGLTFVTKVEELRSRKVAEPCTDGRELVVSKNRHQYVKLLIQRFATSVAEQVKCFTPGFSDLLVNSTYQQFLRALEPEDMDLMLCEGIISVGSLCLENISRLLDNVVLSSSTSHYRVVIMDDCDQELVGLILDKKMVDLLDLALSADTVNMVWCLWELMKISHICCRAPLQGEVKCANGKEEEAFKEELGTPKRQREK